MCEFCETDEEYVTDNYTIQDDWDAEDESYISDEEDEEYESDNEIEYELDQQLYDNSDISDEDVNAYLLTN